MGKVIVGRPCHWVDLSKIERAVPVLYPDLETRRDTEPLREAIQHTGAVVMGWNAFAMAQDSDFYAGNYEFQVPIFVLTHTPPPKQPKETDQLTFTFVTDGIDSAIAQARRAAGDQDVTVIGGARTVQQCLRPDWPMSCMLTLCRCCLAAGFDLLRRWTLTKSGWMVFSFSR